MNPLKSVQGTIILGFVVAIVIAVVIEGGLNLWSAFTWLHVFFGVIWIGLLYYFNFVQMPAVAEAAGEQPHIDHPFRTLRRSAGRSHPHPEATHSPGEVSPAVKVHPSCRRPRIGGLSCPLPTFG